MLQRFPQTHPLLVEICTVRSSDRRASLSVLLPPFGCLLFLLLPLLFGCDSTEPRGSGRSAGASPSGQGSVVVRLGYNRYMMSSFSDAPSPLEVIQTEVARRYPQITVELSLVPESVRGHHDALVVWMMAQDGTVDIFGLDAPWVAEFGAAGWAEPLEPHLSKLRENFLPTGLDVFSYQGQCLGVPIWTSIGGLFCRTDLLEQAGLSEPCTYDQLAQYAKTVVE